MRHGKRNILWNRMAAGARLRGGGGRKRATAQSRSAGAAILLLLSAQASEAVWSSRTFGGCTFYDDGSGAVARSGSCPDQTGNLYFDGRLVTGFTPGVFDNMGACE